MLLLFHGVYSCMVYTFERCLHGGVGLLPTLLHAASSLELGQGVCTSSCIGLGNEGACWKGFSDGGSCPKLANASGATEAEGGAAEGGATANAGAAEATCATEAAGAAEAPGVDPPFPPPFAAFRAEFSLQSFPLPR